MKRRKRKKGFLLIILVLGFFLFISFIFDKQASPLLKYYAKNQGTSAATKIINDSVEKYISEHSEITNFAVYEKNSNGGISAINIDTLKLNSFKAGISSQIVSDLKNIEKNPISIPMGTLTGISFFYGSGPKLKLKIIPQGSVKTDIETNFYSSGINQTAHRIYFTVNTEFFVVLTNSTVSFSVPCKFLLSETVIVGNIPQVYFSQGE